MDLRSGYIAILMVYVTFSGFTRNLVHGGNESTTTEGITDLTSTKSVQLMTSDGTVHVNISSTTISSLASSVSSNAASSLGTSVPSNAASSLGTSVPSNAASSLGTSVSSNAASSLETSVSSNATSSLGTSVSSNAASSLGTSVSSNAASSLGTSVSSTTLSAIGTSVSLTTMSSSTTTASGAVLFTGTAPVNISSTIFSALMAPVPNTTLNASGTSIDNTTLSTIGTSTLLTTKSSSTATTLGAVLQTGTAPVNISSTIFSALMAPVPNTTLNASGTSIDNTTLSTTGTSTLLTTKSSSTATTLGAVLQTGTAPVNISSTKSSALMAAVPNTTLNVLGTSLANTTLHTMGTSTLLTTKSSSTATTLGAVLQTESLKVPQTSCQDLNMPCMNNGTCTPLGTCLCPSSWTGRLCEYPCSSDGCPSEIDVCIIDRKCNLNGTAYCSNKTDCLCFPGWNGTMCNISVCDNYYCYNGGKCRNNSGIAVCDCVKDATGRHCEHNMENSCVHMLPVAVDRIISCTDNIGYYTLMCKPEWTGKNCETPINMTEFCRSNECDSQHMDYCNAVCKRGNCSQEFVKADVNDEYSGEDRLYSEAAYGPRECSFTVGDPWDMCNISNCTERFFADGFCQSSCNNEGCLYDGYDCIEKGFLEDCSPYFNTPCSCNLTFDGKCDTECNTTDCLYDGFDCALSELSPLPGQLVIQVQQPTSGMDSILRKIGLLLRSGVNKTFIIAKPDDGAVAVYLKLTCSGLVNKKCFTSIQSAAKFLAAYVAKLKVPHLFVRDIFACEDGFYGVQGCQNRCSDGCKNSTSREICHKHTGKCLGGCRDEFYGSMCDKKCNDSCGEGVGRRCHVDNGNCTYPCKKDHYGPKCDQVCSNKCLASCDKNGTCIGGCQGNLSYGSHCEKKCPEKCPNSTCDHLGKCHVCTIGYHGDDCTKGCPVGCSEGCSQTTGDCFKCKAQHHGNKCEADALHSKHKEETPVKTDYTGVIVGVIASVFIIAGAILIAFLCWRRQQSGDYILKEEAGTRTNANLEAVTTVQDQNSHIANFASSKDAVDLDDIHDNSVYAGRSQATYVKSTDHDQLAENSPETTLGINNHSQIQPSVEITLTADLDESNEKFVNSGRVDLKLPPPDYAAETGDTDDQSSDDREDVVVRNSGLLVAGGAPLAASEASLLSKDTLDEPPQPDDEPPQPDDQFMFEDGNFPKVTEADFNEGNISDEEEEEKEIRKSSSSSSSSDDN